MAAIEFALFAPNNEAIKLLGSFSDWQEIDMDKGEDGYFRTTVELKDGDHEYKFRVKSKSFFAKDKWLDVADPYATRINDNEHQNGIVTIKHGQRMVDDYAWQHDDKPLPPDHGLIIYEMHIRDFSGGESDPDPRGRYEHVIEKLDYLSDLGITAIEFLPFQEFPGSQGWGYLTRYYFAAESSYGSSKDLKRLIDLCHERGIRVIMDLVINHSDTESPFTQIDHDYWYLHEPKDKEHNWGPEFDYHKYDERFDLFPARKFANEVVRFWASEYHIDGIRFDAVKQLNNLELLAELNATAKDAAGDKPFFTIAEHIPEIPEVTGPEGPLDSAWHNSFYHGLMAHLCGERLDLEEMKTYLDGKRKGFPGATNLVNYLSSHDENHVMAMLAKAEIHGLEAFKRAKLGAVLVMTAMGVPMFFMGSEFGEYKEKDALHPNKIDWAILTNNANKELFEFYKGLISLRKEHPALHGADISFIHDNPEAGVLAYLRRHEDRSVLVIANLSGSYHSHYALEGLDEGGWYEWTAGFDVSVEGGRLVLDLPEYEAKVLVR